MVASKSNRPAPRQAALPERFNLKNATIFGGASLIHQFLERVGIPRLLAEKLAPHEKASHSRYSLFAETLVLLIGRMLGLGRIADFSTVEQDPLLTRLLGLAKLPDVTILYKDLSRLAATPVHAGLQAVHNYVVDLTVGKEVLLDIDSTVETVYGQQQGAAVGYNPTKRGRASFHPQLCFDGLTRTLLDAELRPGNTASSTGLTATVKRVLDGVLAGRTVRLCRGDRGYGNEDFMHLLEQRSIDFILKVTGTKPLRAWADGLSYDQIGTTPLGDILEVASGMYRAGDWSRARRIVVVRERAKVRPEGQLLDLPVIAEEQFLSTTLDWDEEDIFHSYNQRCTSETTIRTLKEDWSLDAFSSARFAANAVDMLLKGIAYNLTLAMQQRLNPKDRSVVHTAETLRRMWFLLPAVVSSHAGTLLLRLPPEAEHGHYGQARRLLAGLPAMA